MANKRKRNKSKPYGYYGGVSDPNLYVPPKDSTETASELPENHDIDKLKNKSKPYGYYGGVADANFYQPTGATKLSYITINGIWHAFLKGRDLGVVSGAYLKAGYIVNGVVSPNPEPGVHIAVDSEATDYTQCYYYDEYGRSYVVYFWNMSESCDSSTPVANNPWITAYATLAIDVDVWEWTGTAPVKTTQTSGVYEGFTYYINSGKITDIVSCENPYQ